MAENALRLTSVRAAVGLGLSALGVIASDARAAINWGPATTISGDSDVSAAGTTVAAYNIGGTTSGQSAPVSTTINTVTFQPFTVADQNSTTVGNVTVSETQAGVPVRSYVTAGTTTPYTSLSTSYQALLGDSVASGITESIEVNFANLMLGQQYQVQVWSNLPGVDNAVIITGGPTLLGSVPTDSTGGVGQFATGTFTANETSLAIFLSGDPNHPGFGPFGPLPILSGFQLRAVPEPSMTLGLAGIAAGALVRRRRQ